MNRLNFKKLGRGFLHLLFWLISIAMFAFIFRLSETISKLDVLYAVLFHISIVLSVYLNFAGLTLWLDKRQYIRYILFALTNILVTIILNQYTFNVLVDIILPDYYFVSQFNNLEIGIITTIFLTITSSIKLSKSWFELQKMSQQVMQIEKETIDTELQSLRSQINPHFLFNSLNVIYSLTLNNDKATPEVVLKLSDILRYVIYDSTQGQVLLSSEESLLKKYIDLQRYRVEEEASINFNSTIKYDAEVAPLIFLTLLENSFKHGIKSDIENVFIDIKLYSDTQKIVFEIENNQPEEKLHNDQKQGLGLENIKKRLELQYPNKHQFSIFDQKNTFKVYLEIKHGN